MVSPWFRPCVTAEKSESNKHVSIDRFSQCCPAIPMLFAKRIGKCEKYPTGKKQTFACPAAIVRMPSASLMLACQTFSK
jgi:hypothetical protein